MALILVSLPVWMLAEERTMTCVMGRPPMRPLKRVAHALGDELPVGGGDALVRIELVGGLHAEQRLEARHNGDGDAQGPHRCCCRWH